MRKIYLNVLLSSFLASVALGVSGQIALNQGSVAALPPVPPIPPSPIDDFRRWLLQTPGERAASLASKMPEQRTYLLSKLAEYQALSPAERDAKLQLLELRWYLRPLMEVSPQQRTNAVAHIPALYRGIIQERLQQWDALPGELQKDVLENEWTMHYFVRFNAQPKQREELLKKVDPAQRKLLEEKIARWDSLSPGRRDRMYQQFNHFFQLPQNERTKTLGVMSESERAEMEGTLKAFENLPSAQRRVCIESFEKFTNMSPEERREFLRDAARWQSMSEKERKAWRNLVTALPPVPDTTPLPPFPRAIQPNPLIVSNSPAPTFPSQ